MLLPCFSGSGPIHLGGGRCNSCKVLEFYLIISWFSLNIISTGYRHIIGNCIVDELAGTETGHRNFDCFDRSRSIEIRTIHYYPCINYASIALLRLLRAWVRTRRGMEFFLIIFASALSLKKYLINIFDSGLVPLRNGPAVRSQST